MINKCPEDGLGTSTYIFRTRYRNLETKIPVDYTWKDFNRFSILTDLHIF